MNPGELAEIEKFVGVGGVLAGKYRIDRVLGVGGMGAVVEAHHLQLHESVAIKFLLTRAGQSELLATRFLREARTASKLKSAHVARVFDVDSRPDGTPFIVMEYLHGETLAARFSREPRLSAEDVVDDVLEACVALAEAHSLGIVHRDLKPANLFLASGPGGVASVRVLDFGISKLLEPNTSGDVITLDLPIGSPPYMSPEQLTLPASVDHRTDIWSLGVVLYEGLSGQLPFSGETFAQVCANVLQATPKPLSQPGELDALVQRCLMKERSQRFQSIAELAQALSPHAGERGKRALSLVQTLSKAVTRSPVAAASHPELVRTATAHDVGTLTATAKSTQGSSSAPKRDRRLLLALGVIPVIGALLLMRLRTDPSTEHQLRSDARHSAEPSATQPLEPSRSLPPSPSVGAATSASAVATPSAAPSASSRVRNGAGARKTKPAPPPAREFDPVFDERR